jgi:TPR repeat protein
MHSALRIIVTFCGLLVLVTPAWAETEAEKLIATAKLGSVDSQFRLGQMYRTGFITLSDGSTIEKNLPEAARWLSEAAKKDVHAKAWLAGLTSSYDYDKRDDAAAVILFAEIARSNDPDKDLIRSAQFSLGNLLYQECTGYLISLDCGPNQTSPYKNYQSAAGWFELAAKSGHREAQFQLASMYEHGRGVPQDFMEAARLYQAAAEAGHEEATVMLGELYVRMQNKPAAYMWFNLAAADGRYGAAEKRDKLANRMSAAEIAEGQKQTRDYSAGHKSGASR